MTAWDGWTARLARRSAEAVAQPRAYPRVDLAVANPVAAIMAAPEFAETADFFNTPDPNAPALVSAYTQALLYSLVRNLRPEHVIEVGTYRTSTSQAMCRALHANGSGFLHTVDPNDSAAIIRVIRRWPRALRERLCYYPTSSMEFFTRALYRGFTSDLVFVDGNHDYEFALFDILSAARLIRPDGFLAIDNISQGGPVYAARNFVRDFPAWRECGHALGPCPRGKAFDPARSTIAGTDLCMLRAPGEVIIGRRFASRGQEEVTAPRVEGIELTVAAGATGMLHAQFVVRVVQAQTIETTAETSLALSDASGIVRVALPWVFEPHEIPLMRTIELWLSWSGDTELRLNAPPALY